MKNFRSFLFVALALVLFVACSDKKKKGREIDYTPLKSELKLDATKEKQFDDIIAKYKKIQKDNYEAAKAQGGNVDRVAMGIKSEQLRDQQKQEMEKVLTPEQMVVFSDFVAKNSRQRPRYNNDLLEKIKKEDALTDEQFAVVNAANDAFEKSFHDAHDVYHGNNKLASEYWNKFDNQRKAAIKSVLSPEQYTKFEEIVKDVKFEGRK